MSISKMYSGYVSQNGNTIAKTAFGLYWIREGRILRPATTYEWEFSQSWGVARVLGKIGFESAPEIGFAKWAESNSVHNWKPKGISVDEIRGCGPQKKIPFAIKVDGRVFAYYYTPFGRLRVTEPTAREWKVIYYAVTNCEACVYPKAITGQPVGALCDLMITEKQATAMGMADLVESAE